MFCTHTMHVVSVLSGCFVYNGLKVSDKFAPLHIHSPPSLHPFVEMIRWWWPDDFPMNSFLMHAPPAVPPDNGTFCGCNKKNFVGFKKGCIFAAELSA